MAQKHLLWTHHLTLRSKGSARSLLTFIKKATLCRIQLTNQGYGTRKSSSADHTDKSKLAFVVEHHVAFESFV